MADIISKELIDLDREKLVKVSKPLFYGYMFLAGTMIISNSVFAGTVFGLAILSALAFTSAALAQSMKTEWKRFLDLIAIMTLLLAVLFGSYMSLAISMGMMGI